MGMSSTFMRASPRNNKATGMPIYRKTPGGTMKKIKKSKAPPMAIKINCFKVKGPTIFSSVSINWGTWNLKVIVGFKR